ncbi:zinc finger, CW-type containing protein [Tanacetum coccineum]
MAVEKPSEGINLRKTIDNHNLPKERSNRKRSYRPPSLESPHVPVVGNELGSDVVAAMVIPVVQEDWEVVDTVSPPKFDFATDLFYMLSMGNGPTDKVSIAASYADALWAEGASTVANTLEANEASNGQVTAAASAILGNLNHSIRKSECPRELEPVDRKSSIHVNLIRRDENCPVSLFS